MWGVKWGWERLFKALIFTPLPHQGCSTVLPNTPVNPPTLCEVKGLLTAHSEGSPPHPGHTTTPDHKLPPPPPLVFFLRGSQAKPAAGPRRKPRPPRDWSWQPGQGRPPGFPSGLLTARP